MFPRTLADLKAADDPGFGFSFNSFYGSLKELRKDALSIPHRLSSILIDAKFAQQVASTYNLPLIANERCGSWYVPADKKIESAYFKSTDGHTGQWSFSLRRLNLQILDVIRQNGGCVIVDSTRRGKCMPDAFSKTIPIWCAVINRVLFPERKDSHHLQCPATGVPSTEVVQIESRLADFVQAFQDLNLDIETLRKRLEKPIRLGWAADHNIDLLPPLTTGPNEKTFSTFFNVILCSASRQVRGAEMSEGGYIQGAGDDSEHWSHGLTAQLFWQHKDILLGTTESELPELIEQLILCSDGHGSRPSITMIGPTREVFIGTWSPDLKWPDFDLIIHCHGSDIGNATQNTKQIFLQCSSGKSGGRKLRQKLETVKLLARRCLMTERSTSILITCETGKDLCVGVALTLLCLFYPDTEHRLNGTRVGGTSQAKNPVPHALGNLPAQKIDKPFIRQRLAWITSSKPDANPSRSTLQSVHAYLMERP